MIINVDCPNESLKSGHKVAFIVSRNVMFTVYTLRARRARTMSRSLTDTGAARPGASRPGSRCSMRGRSSSRDRIILSQTPVMRRRRRRSRRSRSQRSQSLPQETLWR